MSKTLLVYCHDMYNAPSSTTDTDVITYAKNATISSITAPRKDYDLIVFYGGHGDFRSGSRVQFNGLNHSNATALISKLHTAGVNSPKIICDSCFSAGYVPELRTLLTPTFQPSAIYCYLGSSPGNTHTSKDGKVKFNPKTAHNPAARSGALGLAVEKWVRDFDGEVSSLASAITGSSTVYRPYALYVQGRNGANPTLHYVGQNHTQQASNTYIDVIGGGMGYEWTDIQSLKNFLTTSGITLRADTNLDDFTISVRNTFGI